MAYKVIIFGDDGYLVTHDKGDGKEPTAIADIRFMISPEDIDPNLLQLIFIKVAEHYMRPNSEDADE